MKEILKNSDYFVTEIGDVHSKKRKTTIKLSPFITKFGYKYVSLYLNGQQQKFSVHRLVARAFIPNPLNKPQVNHIDGNKQNNKVENLEWVTASENAKHAIKLGLWDKERLLKFSFDKRTPVLMLTIDDIPLLWFDSQNEASRKTNINQRSIYNCCNKKDKTAGGYKWEYKLDI